MTVTITEIVALNERGAVGGRLWLDDTGGRGRVVLLGYGRAWTHCWLAKGRGGAPLGPWLADSKIEDLARRMGANRWYDAEATTAEARRLICRDRRDECLDSDEARELFTATEYLDAEADAGGWFHDYCRRSSQSDTWEDCPIRYAVDPEFRRAMELLLPLLKEVTP